MKRRAVVGSGLALVALSAFARTAGADGILWAPVSLGGAALHDADARRTFPEFAANAGLGAGGGLAHGDWMLGALVTGTSYVTRGFDLGGVVRLASGSFSDTSGFAGVAFDVGVADRLWGDGSFGRAPLQVRFTYVIPGGIEFMLVAEPLDLTRGIETPSAGAYVGFDIGRLGRGMVSAFTAATRD